MAPEVDAGIDGARVGAEIVAPTGRAEDSSGFAGQSETLPTGPDGTLTGWGIAEVGAVVPELLGGPVGSAAPLEMVEITLIMMNVDVAKIMGPINRALDFISSSLFHEY